VAAATCGAPGQLLITLYTDDYDNVHNGPLIIFGLGLVKSDPLLTTFTFSFLVTLTFDLWTSNFIA